MYTACVWPTNKNNFFEAFLSDSDLRFLQGKIWGMETSSHNIHEKYTVHLVASYYEVNIYLCGPLLSVLS